MAGIIKGGLGFGYIPAAGNDEPIMKTIYGAHPTENVQPKEKVPTEEVTVEEPVLEQVAEPVEEVVEQPIPDEPEIEQEPEQEELPTVVAEEVILEQERILRECEEMRKKYELEAEQLLDRANERAQKIADETRENALKTIEQANEQAVQIKKDAADEGRKQGYEDGRKTGYDEGYVAALKKCKDALVELKTTNEKIIAEKEQIFRDYERQLFDTIFEIAQKITVNSLKQKDKTAISKMIKEAGKRYRGSKNVKISLSSLDISEEAQLDDEILAEAFRDGTNIEIEILKDAPEGTLIIDDGSEITDAGVPTQLKMIEQLGKGKYRDKNLHELIRTKMAAMEPSEEVEGN